MILNKKNIIIVFVILIMIPISHGFTNSKYGKYISSTVTKIINIIIPIR